MIDDRFLHYKTLQGFQADLSLYGDALNDKIVFIKDKALIWTHGQYYASDNSEGDTPPIDPIIVEKTKHVFLTQEQYDSLEEYERNTIYFILEPEVASNWAFGGEFPITLT